MQIFNILANLWIEPHLVRQDFLTQPSPRLPISSTSTKYSTRAFGAYAQMSLINNHADVSSEFCFEFWSKHSSASMHRVCEQQRRLADAIRIGISCSCPKFSLFTRPNQLPSPTTTSLREAVM